MKNIIKMMKYIASILILMLVACASKEQKQAKPIDDKILKEKMIVANKYLSRSENEEIAAYVKRRGWPTINKNSGLRYFVYEKGKGGDIRFGDNLLLKYKLTLLNGIECYNSNKDGLLRIEIGNSGVSGLNEALKLLKRGDKAKIIVPSYMGYGLMGDEKKIPTKATLVYDIQIPE